MNGPVNWLMIHDAFVLTQEQLHSAVLFSLADVKPTGLLIEHSLATCLCFNCCRHFFSCTGAMMPPPGGVGGHMSNHHHIMGPPPGMGPPHHGMGGAEMMAPPGLDMSIPHYPGLTQV